MAIQADTLNHVSAARYYKEPSSRGNTGLKIALSGSVRHSDAERLKIDWIGRR